MTLGELLRLVNAERTTSARRVEVVAMRGWSRDLWYDETGLEWINPSPNMRSLTAAALYPGVGLLETTNVSVGRGTDTPFEVVGAPWIDAVEARRRTSTRRRMPGVRFTPVHFTPVLLRPRRRALRRSPDHRRRPRGSAPGRARDRDRVRAPRPPPGRLGPDAAREH